MLSLTNRHRSSGDAVDKSPARSNSTRDSLSPPVSDNKLSPAKHAKLPNTPNKSPARSSSNNCAALSSNTATSESRPSVRLASSHHTDAGSRSAAQSDSNTHRAAPSSDSVSKSSPAKQAKPPTTPGKLSSRCMANSRGASTSNSGTTDSQLEMHLPSGGTAAAGRKLPAQSTSRGALSSNTDSKSSPVRQAKQLSTADKSTSRRTSDNRAAASSNSAASESRSLVHSSSRRRVSSTDAGNKSSTHNASITHGASSRNADSKSSPAKRTKQPGTPSKSALRSNANNNNNVASSSNSAVSDSHLPVPSTSSHPPDAVVQSSARNDSSSHGAANSDSKLSPAKKTKKLPEPYVYTALKDIKPGTSVNVFGVVKYVRAASRGRGAGETVPRISLIKPNAHCRGSKVNNTLQV